MDYERNRNGLGGRPFSEAGELVRLRSCRTEADAGIVQTLGGSNRPDYGQFPLSRSLSGATVVVVQPVKAYNRHVSFSVAAGSVRL